MLVQAFADNPSRALVEPWSSSKQGEVSAP